MIFRLIVFYACMISTRGYGICPQYSEEQIKTISNSELKAQKKCLENIKTENEYLLQRVNQLFLLNESYCDRMVSFQSNCILMSRFQESTRNSCQESGSSRIETPKFSISTQADTNVSFRVVVELFSSPNGFIFHSQAIEKGPAKELVFQDQLGGVVNQSPPLAMVRQIYLETTSGESFPSNFLIESFTINGQLLFDDGSVSTRDRSKISISLGFVDDILSNYRSCQISPEELNKIQQNVQEAFE